MPTGYTAPLHDGEAITFEQFAMRCARAMGAAIMQRDDAPDVELQLRTVDDYLEKKVEKARTALNDAFEGTLEDWAALQESKITEARRYRDEYVSNRREVRARYDAMLSAATGWTPPTSEHEGLRKFMIDQLEESIRFDCGDYAPSVPDSVPVSDYRAKELERLTGELNYAIKRLREEQDRVRGQNEWVTALRDNLTIGK